MGDSLSELVGELKDLQQALVYAGDLNDLAAEVAGAAQANPFARYGLAITGHNHEEIRREIEYALKAVPAAFEKAAAEGGAVGSAEWQTPLGSYFTPNPPGGRAGWPSFTRARSTRIPGMGKDLFRLFPDLHQTRGASPLTWAG